MTTMGIAITLSNRRHAIDMELTPSTVGWANPKGDESRQRIAMQMALRLGAAANRTDVAQVWAEVMQALVGWNQLRLDLYMPQTARVSTLLNLSVGHPRQAASGTNAAPRRPLAQCIELSLPLARGAALVQINVERDRAYTEVERLLVADIAEHCRNAMGRADSHERLQDAYRRIVVFGRLAHRLGLQITPHEAGQLIADVADELIGWDACYFDLFDASSDTIQEMINIDTIDGVKRPVEGHHINGPPGTLERRMLAEGAFIVEQDPRSPSEYGLFGDESKPSAAMMFVPARFRDEVVAFVSLQSYTPQAYTREDLELLQTLADNGGGALARIRLEERMRASEQRYAIAARGANDGLWDWNVITGMVHFSARWRQILGEAAEDHYEPVGAWWARVADNERAALMSHIEDHFAGRTEYLHHEHWVRQADGSLCRVLLRGVVVLDVHGAPQRMAGSMTALTAGD